MEWSELGVWSHRGVEDCERDRELGVERSQLRLMWSQLCGVIWESGVNQKCCGGLGVVWRIGSGAESIGWSELRVWGELGVERSQLSVMWSYGAESIVSAVEVWERCVNGVESIGGWRIGAVT